MNSKKPSSSKADMWGIYEALGSIDLRLRLIERTLLYLVKQGGMEMANLQDIKDAVAAEADVQASVVTLLGELSAKLAEAIAQNDPAAIQQVVDDINAHRQALADAVVANTPVAPAP